VIRLERLTKRYGDTTAVDDISAVIEPGRVTGFLGPNGAGKSTTMRMIVGLDRPTAGTAIVNGKRYAEHRAPLREVGSLLEARAMHPGRTAANHLRAVAATHGIPRSRVEEVLGLTGLTAVANKRVGKFSLGMGQRLGIAVALLGDPRTLILDEPVNGLDPDGVLWVRHLTRSLAAEGRTVFLSSHLMSEMAQTADHLLVLGRGRILADAPIADVVAGATQGIVRVRTPDGDRLDRAVAGTGVTVRRVEDGSFEVLGATPAQIGDAALAAGIPLHELTPVSASLEEAYLTLTKDDVEYRETQGAVR
jgi:ABC-2 type transport system ATP-binding protein